MLVQMAVESESPGPPSRVLDSPILARVERVLLRHDEGFSRDRGCLPKPEYNQFLLSSNYGNESTATIKRGLLWQQQKKLFSRWKERYFILTRDYLYCFQKASGNDRISEMGQFLFKVKLVDIERVEWENKKTYSIVALFLGRNGKIYLRTPDGLEDWFELIEECVIFSKQRRKTTRLRDNNNATSSLGEWMLPYSKQMRHFSTDMARQVMIKRHNGNDSNNIDWERPTLDNRLSLLTDIDTSTYNDSTLEVPSITSYKMNQEALRIKPSSLICVGSFRSTREPPSYSRNIPNVQDIQFRERSCSAIQKNDKRLGPLTNINQSAIRLIKK